MSLDESKNDTRKFKIKAEGDLKFIISGLPCQTEPIIIKDESEIDMEFDIEPEDIESITALSLVDIRFAFTDQCELNNVAQLSVKPLKVTVEKKKEDKE